MSERVAERSRLSDRVALVTGAAGGLGTAICEGLEREGAIVFPVDLVGEGCLRADVGTENGNREMIAAVLERHGRLDVLVLNAGVQFLAPIAAFPESEWDRLMNVLVKGPYLALKAAWGPLTARPGGRVIVTASASSYVAERFKAAYVSAKHGVRGLVKVAALEGAPFGLTVNAIAPGRVWTPFLANQVDDQMRLRGLTREQVIDDMLTRYPVKRFVDAREVAEVVVFLASAASSGINGACFPVDLGFSVG
jgi:3-hydroxybutyrate dehydrogenase